MRAAYCAVGAILFACNLAGLGETPVPCSQTVSQTLQPRAVLIIDSRPAGIHIVGTDRDELHVSCTAASDDAARNVFLHFSPKGSGGTLSIRGSHLDHNNNLNVTIEIPRRTNLSVHMSAGQVSVEEIKGDKDIGVGAGQITISSIHDGDYRSVHASVSIGQVSAQAFGVDKGGFFRSLDRDNSSGDYRLRAHVTTGQIQLLGNTEQEGKPD